MSEISFSETYTISTVARSHKDLSDHFKNPQIANCVIFLVYLGKFSRFHIHELFGHLALGNIIVFFDSQYVWINFTQYLNENLVIVKNSLI